MPPPQRPGSAGPGQQQAQNKPTNAPPNQYAPKTTPPNHPPVQRSGPPGAGPVPQNNAQNGASYRTEATTDSPTPVRMGNNNGNPRQPPPQIGFSQKPQTAGTAPQSGISGRSGAGTHGQSGPNANGQTGTNANGQSGPNANGQTGPNAQSNTATSDQNPPVGFFTGRSAMPQEGNGNKIPESFNPHRPTNLPWSSGVDHSKSSPIARKQLHNNQPHNIPRPNFENPSLTPNRMIGAPPGRGPYRPPGVAVGGIKRPADPYPSANHPYAILPVAS